MRARSLILPLLATVVVAVVALTLANERPAPGGAEASAVVLARTAPVRISNYLYHPAKLTVKVGAKLVVTNSDGTAHTLTANSGAFDSGTVGAGGRVSFTVNKPGVYTYYCRFHAFMHGTLTVIR